MYVLRHKCLKIAVPTNFAHAQVQRNTATVALQYFLNPNFLFPI